MRDPRRKLKSCGAWGATRGWRNLRAGPRFASRDAGGQPVRHARMRARTSRIMNTNVRRARTGKSSDPRALRRELDASGNQIHAGELRRHARRVEGQDGADRPSRADDGGLGAVHRRRARWRAPGCQRGGGLRPSRSCVLRSVLPWQTDVAWFASDLWCGGKPFEACSRNILKRAMAQAPRTLGYGLQSRHGGRVLRARDDARRRFRADLATARTSTSPPTTCSRLLDNMHWIGELVDAMNDLGWDVYSLRPRRRHRPVRDRFHLFRCADDGRPVRVLPHDGARNRAQARRLRDFMPKPYRRSRRQRRAFQHVARGSRRPARICSPTPPTARLQALEARLPVHRRRAAAICPRSAPSSRRRVNSYKRLDPAAAAMSGFTWAPVFACYGNNNRTNTLRIPLARRPRRTARRRQRLQSLSRRGAWCWRPGSKASSSELDPGEPHTENMYLKTRGGTEAAGRRAICRAAWTRRSTRSRPIP